MPIFKKKLAIDLGTANTLVYMKGTGIILNEPSVVAINYLEKKAIAIGHEAKGFMGRTPQHIKSFRPLKDGLMVDFTSTKVMLAEFYKKISSNKKMKSKAVFVVPTAITDEEKKAIRGAAKEVGCSKVFFLSEAMAAALGAGLDISENRGRLIINIGGSTCEVAVIINSTVSFSRVTSFAGDAIDDAVIRHLRDEYGVHIGEYTAEKCKENIGSALPEAGKSFSLTGKDIQTNAPRPIEVDSVGLGQAISEPLEVLENFIKDSFTKIGAQHMKDAMEDGVLLVGGGSLLSGLKTFLTDKLGIPVVQDKEPLVTVVKGGGIAIDRKYKYRKIFIK
ncbi:MAG: rod shape-determining protein MreB [Thermodesulfobacteriota bacterium]